MTYVGICEDNKPAIMAYSLMSTVVSTEEALFKSIFEEDCTMIVLTDTFIDRVLKWASLSDFLHETRKIKSKFRVVIVGTDIRYSGDDAHVLKINWEAASTTLKEAEKMSVLPLKYTSVTSDVRETLLSNLNDLSALFNYIVNSQERVIPFMRQILLENEHTGLEMLELLSTIDTLTLENAVIHAKLESVESRYDRLYQFAQLVMGKYNTLVDKIRNQYNRPYIADGEEGFDIVINNYSAILVVKEYTRVKYVDSLLYYVQSILSQLYTTPTRYLVIEKAYSYSSAKLYPYHIDANDMTYRDLKSSDVCMVGYRKDILESILQNPGKAKYLIILDRSGVDFLPCRGDKVDTLYTLSDMTDNRIHEIPIENIISYSGSTFNIPHVDGFSEMSDDLRLQSYSSMDVTKNIISKIELNG